MIRMWMMPLLAAPILFATSTLLDLTVENAAGPDVGIVAEPDAQSGADTYPVTLKLLASRGALAEGLYRDHEGRFARLKFVMVNERLAIQRGYLGADTFETLWVDAGRDLAVIPKSSMSILATADGGIALAAQTSSGGVPAVLVWSGLGLPNPGQPHLVLPPRSIDRGSKGALQGALVCSAKQGISNPQLMNSGTELALLYEVQILRGVEHAGPERNRTAIVCSKLELKGSTAKRDDAGQGEAHLVAFGDRASVATGDQGCLVVYNDELQPGDRYKVRRFLRRGADNQWSTEDWTLPGDLKWGSEAHAIYAGNQGYILVALFPASGPNPGPAAAGQTGSFVTLVTATLVWEGVDFDVDGVTVKGGVTFTEVSKPVFRGGSCGAALCAGIGPEGGIHSYAIFCD